MKKQIYPSWRYHKDLGAKIIQDESQESPEWKDSPVLFEAQEEKEQAQEPIEIKEIEIPKEVKKSKKK